MNEWPVIELSRPWVQGAIAPRREEIAVALDDLLVACIRLPREVREAHWAVDACDIAEATAEEATACLVDGVARIRALLLRHDDPDVEVAQGFQHGDEVAQRTSSDALADRILGAGEPDLQDPAEAPLTPVDDLEPGVPQLHPDIIDQAAPGAQTR